MRAKRVALAAALAVTGLFGFALDSRAETVGFPDPVGDAGGSGHPAGDIYGVGLGYEGTTAGVGVAIVDPEHPADWLPSETTGFSAALDIDGNSSIDYTAYFTSGGGAVYRLDASRGSYVCSAVRDFEDDIYLLAFAASCIGSPPSFRARIFFTNDYYDSNDFAPSPTGWSPVVRRSGGSGPPPPPQSSQPRGSFDGIARQPGSATAAGWAVDNDSPNSAVEIHIYANGQPVASGRADRPREDVAAAVPGAGPNHGFAIPIPLSGAGPHRICAFAINIGGGPNPQLGCHTLTTAPFGSIDSIRESRAGVATSGWAIDPDTADPVDVHIHVNGSPAVAIAASGDRPDVGRSHPGYGNAHGWSAEVPVGAGTHNICAYAIDRGHGSQNTSLGCRRLTITRDPIGSFDAAGRDGSNLLVEGWAADWEADTTTVHVYANGAFLGAVTADRPRPDVHRAHPEFGPNVGYRGSLSGAPAGAKVCVYALNAGPGANKLLGCRTA